jgi:hypothetical protein
MSTETVTTKTKKQIATFKIKSPNNFIAFLKRFSSIEKSLLLELTPEHLMAKSYTPDRSTIKYSKIALAEVLEGEVPAKLMKIALLNIAKVTNVFSHFNSGDEIFLDIQYDEINEEVIAFTLKFYTKALKITLTCADPIQFTYISSDALKRIVKSVADEEILKFPFPKDAFAKINSLCGIDAETDLLKIKVTEDGAVYFKSKSFEYHILDVPAGKGADMAFYNNQFGFIDQEVSAFHLCPTKLLVRSTDSDTMIILGRIER